MNKNRSLTLFGLAAATVAATSGLCGTPALAAAQPPPVLSASAQQSLDGLLAKAVAENDLDAARALLEKGAYANTVLPEGHRSGGNVLHAAALDGHADLVKRLLDHGADPNHRNTHFKTPRDLAQEAGHTAIADLLRRAEDGTYTPPSRLPAAPPPPSPAAPAAAKRPAAPKTAGKQKAAPPAKRVAAKGKAAGKSRTSTNAGRQAKARKKLNDYNYVKQNFGLGGTTYRSFKW